MAFFLFWSDYRVLARNQNALSGIPPAILIHHAVGMGATEIQDYKVYKVRV